MRSVPAGDISHYVERYLQLNVEGARPTVLRERSWDFCFNYFQAHPKPTQQLELSCLQLGYYLASWGMLRGAAYLSRTNATHYETALKVIEERTDAFSGVDLHRYHDQATRTLLLETYQDLRAALLPEGGDPHTLVTKVMMGVWGVIPAFDRYFVGCFHQLAESRKERGAFNSPRELSLVLMGDFYTHHAQEIDQLASQLSTVDFTTGARTQRLITKAKVLDMYGFQAGFEVGRLTT